MKASQPEFRHLFREPDRHSFYLRGCMTQNELKAVSKLPVELNPINPWPEALPAEPP